MIINIGWSLKFDPTLQPLPVKVLTGEALLLDILGVPAQYAGESVIGVHVEVINPDNESAALEAVPVNGLWRAQFGESFFTSYGTVLRGVRITARTATTEAPTIVADLEVKPSTPDANPGTGASVEIVTPSADATDAQAAAALATYNLIDAAKTLAESAESKAETAINDAFDYHKDAIRQIDALDAAKQNKLTAGENITIEGNVISATGGGGGGTTTIAGMVANLVAIGDDGAPVDAGYRFEVRDGIPCIVQTI